MKRWIGILAVLVALVSGAGGARAEFIVVEFSEVNLPNLTPLAGNPAFAPFGLEFGGASTYAIDNRFIGAGTDDRGITTVGGSVGDVIFTTPVTTLTFFSLRIDTVFTASVLDAGGNLLDSITFTGGSGVVYNSHTFSDVGAIATLRFRDNQQFIGIGRLEYTPVPEPASLTLLGLGSLVVFCQRHRLKGTRRVPS